jgi:hypothetical protein
VIITWAVWLVVSTAFYHSHYGWHLREAFYYTVSAGFSIGW